MTAKEIQKRNKKAEQLRVIQVDPETYYVESSDGKICYLDWDIHNLKNRSGKKQMNALMQK